MSAETVLLVDDEETDLERMRQILLCAGYTVVKADTYQAALEVFDRHRNTVRFLVSDISLPGGNGCELALAIRHHKPDLRVLFVSGHVGAEVCRYYGLEVTDEHFLSKPFGADELLSRVSVILNSLPSFPSLCEPPRPKTRTGSA